MHATTIIGYQFRADLFCPGHIIQVLPTHAFGAFDGWALAEGATMSVEDNLDELAHAFGIDRMNESSFDSDDFPKVVFGDYDGRGQCGTCGCYISEPSDETKIDWFLEDEGYNTVLDWAVAQDFIETEEGWYATSDPFAEQIDLETVILSVIENGPATEEEEETVDDTYLILGVAGDGGSLVQLVGQQGDKLYLIHADHRMAQVIIEAMCDGEEPVAYAESWSVTRLPDGYTDYVHPEAMDR